MASIDPEDDPYISKDGRRSWRVKWKTGGTRDGVDDSETVYDYEVGLLFKKLIEKNGHRRPPGFPKRCHGMPVAIASPEAITAKSEEPGKKKGKKKGKKAKKAKKAASLDGSADSGEATEEPSKLPTFAEYALDNILGPMEPGPDGKLRRNFKHRGLNREDLSLRQARGDARAAERHVFPVFGSFPLDRIPQSMLLELYSRLAETTKTAQERKPPSDIASARAWAVAAGIKVPASGVLKREVMDGWRAAGSPPVPEPPASGERLSLATINRIIGACVKPVFAAACAPQRDGSPPLIPPGFNPCVGLKIPKEVRTSSPRPVKRRTVVHEEFAVYLRVVGRIWEEAARMLAVKFATGLRWGELSGLRVCDVDFGRKVLEPGSVLRWVADPETGRETLELEDHGKTKDALDRVVPLCVSAAVLLAEQCKGKRPTDLVFTAKQGGKLYHSNFRDRVLIPAEEELARSTGLQIHVTGHMLRHTVSTVLKDEEVPIEMIDRFLGHAPRAGSSNAGPVYRDHVTDKELARVRRGLQPVDDVLATVFPRVRDAMWQRATDARDGVLFQGAVPAYWH